MGAALAQILGEKVGDASRSSEHVLLGETVYEISIFQCEKNVLNWLEKRKYCRRPISRTLARPRKRPENRAVEKNECKREHTFK